MADYHLRIELESDTTFGRGDGVAGLVNQEVEHDPYGLPIIHGRTIKGLVVDACSELMYGLLPDKSKDNASTPLENDAHWLFGGGGSNHDSAGHVYFGTGEVAAEIRNYFHGEVKTRRLSRADVVDAFTVIRRQTAMDATDVPADGSLRAARAVVRKTVFIVPIRFESTPNHDQLALLAACAAGVQRGGSGRTRGRGRLKVELVQDGQPISFDSLFASASGG